MYKRYELQRRVLAALCAVLAASVMSVAIARAAAAPAPASAPSSKPAAPAKAAKVRAPRPPEKSYAERRAIDGPWAKGANWIGFRAGYAKATGENAGGGIAGYGLAYQHMMSNQWAIGATVQHDLVSHLTHSYEVSVPFTLELTRHFKWNTAIRPYVGAGGGYFFHKYYRTGRDYTGAPGSGACLNFGANLPVDDRHALGLDARVAFVAGHTGTVNPVFGAETATETLWSVKLNWALVY